MGLEFIQFQAAREIDHTLKLAEITSRKE